LCVRAHARGRRERVSAEQRGAEGSRGRKFMSERQTESEREREREYE
jgi:hypothetical protein